MTKYKESTNKGRWSKEEHAKFEEGMIIFGKSRWKEISALVKTRSRHQCKSHFQKLEAFSRKRVIRELILRHEERQKIVTEIRTDAEQRLAQLQLQHTIKSKLQEIIQLQTLVDGEISSPASAALARINRDNDMNGFRRANLFPKMNGPQSLCPQASTTIRPSTEMSVSPLLSSAFVKENETAQSSMSPSLTRGNPSHALLLTATKATLYGTSGQDCRNCDYDHVRRCVPFRTRNSDDFVTLHSQQVLFAPSTSVEPRVHSLSRMREEIVVAAALCNLSEI